MAFVIPGDPAARDSAICSGPVSGPSPGGSHRLGRGLTVSPASHRSPSPFRATGRCAPGRSSPLPPGEGSDARCLPTIPLSSHLKHPLIQPTTQNRRPSSRPGSIRADNPPVPSQGRAAWPATWCAAGVEKRGQGRGGYPSGPGILSQAGPARQGRCGKALNTATRRKLLKTLHAERQPSSKR